MKKKIAIIGAGIAGLTFANFIKKNSNFEFIIYEKKDNLILDEGFGIQLAVNSVSILNKIGFNKIQSKNIFHPEKLNFFSINEKKICDLNLTQFNIDETKYTTLQRSTLIEFLKNDIYAQHLRFGKKIKKVTELKNQILINFEDDTNDVVDFLIVADGIFSNTKSLLQTDNNKPKFKNAIAIRSILKSKNDINIDKQNINLIMGANTHLVIYPINNKNELNLVCIVRERKFDPDNIKNLINKKVLSQNSNLKNLFQEKLKSWPLYSTNTTNLSSNKKVFYLGDAFHGLLPTLAQGASQSIEGAYELFNLLNRHDNDDDAQKIYFQNRSRRIKTIKKKSDLNFFAFHVSNSILKKLRNIILKGLVKNKSFINSYLGEVFKY